MGLGISTCGSSTSTSATVTGSDRECARTASDTGLSTPAREPKNIGSAGAHIMDTAAAESPAISEWLQIRKDAAARIDPTTAEVTFNGGRPIGPSGEHKLHLPPDYYCIARTTCTRC